MLYIVLCTHIEYTHGHVNSFTCQMGQELIRFRVYLGGQKKLDQKHIYTMNRYVSNQPEIAAGNGDMYRFL